MMLCGWAHDGWLCDRQERQPNSHCHGQIAEIEILHGALSRKQTVRQVLATLPHSCCLEMFFDKVWVINMDSRDNKLMNSLLLWWFSWLLSIFMMSVDVFLGMTWCTPMIQKNQTMSCHFQIIPLRHENGKICISFMLKECIRLHSGWEVFELLCSIFFQFSTWQMIAVCQWIQHCKKVE